MTLDDALAHHFGYATFRPLQREIAQASLDGRDVLALLPTGAGKSLCYQLPALLDDGLTLVVSPLIALMKDQVDALLANGIPATFLNSSLAPAETAARIARLDRGAYRLLYVAPERAVQADFRERLTGWNLTRIAVDEAHCISEWGHDFRPEYRQIARLRQRHPHVPIAAVTATATQRVREDIERYLELREPKRFVASFDRPNLRYGVFDKRDGLAQLAAWCAARTGESGIVYTGSRQTAEDAARRLTSAGIPALPYHAGLTAQERSRNQELFVRDEVRAICATIAFGMGIDKPNVRYVAHYDVPKNLEGYYQETGRAGRDGLPSECALFFSGADAAKQRRFLTEIEDEQERERAARLLGQMLDFVATGGCRRALLLRYFGERDVPDACGNCDNCIDPPQTVEAGLQAAKLLSCVYRVRAHDGYGSGAHAAVDVLLGRSSERATRRGYDRLSTYGIGSEYTKSEWLALVSELLRAGWLETEPEHRTLRVTARGRTALRDKVAFAFAKPRTIGAKKRRRGEAVEIAGADGSLFDALRVLRKRLADAQGVPPYVVFSDVTLREFARTRPLTLTALRAISGVGDVKLERYGADFLAAIAAHG